VKKEMTAVRPTAPTSAELATMTLVQVRFFSRKGPEGAGARLIRLHIVPAMFDNEVVERCNVEIDLAEEIDKSDEKLGSFATFLVYYLDEAALPPYPTLRATWRSLFAFGRGVLALLEEEVA
jgi:hypothetical protein